jgi:hypothetical protein
MLHICKCFRYMFASVCSKCFYLFLDVCCNRFDLDVYVSHIFCNNMFQNVSAILVLCYSKWFYIASCKCFILMFHMSHIYVASACFICFQSYVIFMLQVFYVVQPWVSRRPCGRGCWGPANGGAVCRGALGHHVLGCSSRPPKCHLRRESEREEGSGEGLANAEMGREVHSLTRVEGGRG